mmetsp:Transcript_39591/g.58166  ORF Transcript_39591/g.58166 Transcript_39591/m.58166 type:complete len:489 (-) Transcript_39591:123-1589(-)|eukprot:CAMPEP_0195519436 /NCGR_PEP_ID=MMETSP0794_2-20130614/14762_1 /TAXON_ID=515487 /ORGANISM="Stephanopyxis turris, Strain CCMP 815" /LENGTH=488 /DNA_ID=CAMNT_0040648587 /DNA_START=280 /DNA_END=1746 /DNA_ORIENTATION=-
MSSGQEVGQIFGEGEGLATSLLRSPTVIIASIGLWGMNVWLFRLFGIDYKRVLLHDYMKLEPKLSEDMGNSDNDQDEEGTANTNITMELSASSQGGYDSGTQTGGGVVNVDNPTIASLMNSTPGSEITAIKLLLLSTFLLTLLHATSYTWINILGGDAIFAIFGFYLLCVVCVCIPHRSTAWVRQACRMVFVRVMELLTPRCYCCTGAEYRAVPFLDVFFADAMCSMSKVFFDWGMLWHLASHYPDPVPSSAHAILIPSAVAALPYIIRARQCIVMHTVGLVKNDPKRYQHVLNAIKYSTSLFPICLSAYQKTVDEDKAKQLELLLVVLLTINALYSYAWDVIMDWGMMQDPTTIIAKNCMPKSSSHASNGKDLGCAQVCLRPRLRFGAFMSIVILVADGILRSAWLLRFYEKDLFPTLDAYILCSEFLEVFRRSIWNLLRVEWENMKHMNATVMSSRTSMSEDDDKCSSNSIAMVSLRSSTSKQTNL